MSVIRPGWIGNVNQYKDLIAVQLSKVPDSVWDTFTNIFIISTTNDGGKTWDSHDVLENYRPDYGGASRGTFAAIKKYGTRDYCVLLPRSMVYLKPVIDTDTGLELCP